MSFPTFHNVRQQFRGPHIDDVAAAVKVELESLSLAAEDLCGKSIAITAGSRGIANIDAILLAIVDFLQTLGAEPFLIPAMGSHGGGTAEGQLAVLETLGITAETMGCPIRASMDTVVIAESKHGFPIHCDRFAVEADDVLVCNRIKPHTMFSGNLQSGLFKMMFTGMGKRAGAKIYHRAAVDYPFAEIVREAAAHIIDKCSVIGGLAIVENGMNETAVVEAIAPENFESRESALLDQATDWMPRLPLQDLDLLIIDEIGKTISGTGMDTNVVGRKFNDHAAVDGEVPRIKRIAVRNVLHGNANGIGVAEFCLRQAIEQSDVQATRINSLTSNHPAAGMLPHAYDTDQEMIADALTTIGMASPEEARIVWIQSTKDLEQFACSSSLAEELRRQEHVDVVDDAFELPWDSTGNLPRILPTMSQ